MPVLAQQSQTPQDKPAAQAADLALPLNFQRHTGDLDDMVKRGTVRALVLYSRSSFFYVDGRPQGLNWNRRSQLSTRQAWTRNSRA